jgi:uncharacterized protein
LGGTSFYETFGGHGPNYVTIESNGEIEGLDALKACASGLTRTGLNIRDSKMTDVARMLDSRTGAPALPTGCRGCPEESTCAGGYLPHRYSNARKFDNPSAWCPDIIKLFSHVRDQLGITPEETRQRRMTRITKESQFPERNL